MIASKTSRPGTDELAKAALPSSVVVVFELMAYCEDQYTACVQDAIERHITARACWRRSPRHETLRNLELGPMLAVTPVVATASQRRPPSSGRGAAHASPRN